MEYILSVNIFTIEYSNSILTLMLGFYKMHLCIHAFMHVLFFIIQVPTYSS